MAPAKEAIEKLRLIPVQKPMDHRTKRPKLSEWLLNSGAYMH